MKFYITGTRRGLGEYLAKQYDTVNTLEECDVFINCKFNKFEQAELLFKAATMGKRIINISSSAPDYYETTPMYAACKNTLDDLNKRLYLMGANTTSLRFGYFDTLRSAHIVKQKMTLEYVASIIQWVLDQPHRIREITIEP